jgi:antitoxin component YwqK of YwqJK toxin-antitoxin module
MELRKNIEIIPISKNGGFISIWILSAILFFNICTISGQSVDSTIYYLYKDKKNVTGVEYITDYYKNGQLKSEGWIVYEKASSQSEIVQINNWANYDTVVHKFGVWKSYYKRGQISEIDSLGNYSSDIVKDYYYFEPVSEGQNCLWKIVTFKPAVSISDVNDKWRFVNENDVEWIHFQYFRLKCNIIQREEHFTGTKIKSGTWKWYKKGKLSKTKEYKDGKKIAKKKF